MYETVGVRPLAYKESHGKAQVHRRHFEDLESLKKSLVADNEFIVTG